MQELASKDLIRVCIRKQMKKGGIAGLAIYQKAACHDSWGQLSVNWPRVSEVEVANS